MTKKDYIRLAEAFSLSRPDGYQLEETLAWEKTLWKVADTLEGDNPRFDRKKFCKVARERP